MSLFKLCKDKLAIHCLVEPHVPQFNVSKTFIKCALKNNSEYSLMNHWYAVVVIKNSVLSEHNTLQPQTMTQQFHSFPLVKLIPNAEWQEIIPLKLQDYCGITVSVYIIFCDGQRGMCL